ncbi:calcium-activated potassium channel subunit alpha-1-like [Amblyraja radiata]|uniref:calcium-activated potassium channel subunit alpha-1-like n=1 Tax=Amblyraja radiata TaxID=386614 RepID=UPI001403C46D|nr:calcium-activated potassium channel subunit alpha-1-like [Amblyraja radiata]
MGNSFFVEFKSKVDGEVINPLQKTILESGEIRKPSHNCRTLSQDMWRGAIGSSFTVFIGGILLILMHRGIAFIYIELTHASNTQDSRWNRGKNRVMSHDVVIAAKHLTNRLVLEKKKKILTAEEIEQLNATETSKIRKVNLSIDVQEWAQRMISAQSLIGRGLVMMVFLLSFGSLFIYFVISIESSEDTRVVLEKLQAVDLGFNSFFLFYFGLRVSDLLPRGPP